MERMASRALAWERGQNALSIIEPRALPTGLGVTYQRTGSAFQRSFGTGGGSPPPAQWTDKGPIQVWEGYPTLLNLAPDYGGTFQGRGLAVLYAMPSNLRIKLDAPMPLSEDELVNLEVFGDGLSALADRLPTTDRSDLWSWVAFPMTRLPGYARYSGGTLALQVPGAPGFSAVLYPYDEVHYLRAQRFYVQDNVMYSQELRSAWVAGEARLEGVLEMWFQWSPSKKLLEAWILTTGGTSSGRTLRPKEWPPGAPWRFGFEFHDVAVVKGSWLLKNM
jgi:hypothetical protein